MCIIKYNDTIFYNNGYNSALGQTPYNVIYIYTVYEYKRMGPIIYTYRVHGCMILDIENVSKLIWQRVFAGD